MMVVVIFIMIEVNVMIGDWVKMIYSFVRISESLDVRCVIDWVWCLVMKLIVLMIVISFSWLCDGLILEIGLRVLRLLCILRNGSGVLIRMFENILMKSEVLSIV